MKYSVITIVMKTNIVKIVNPNVSTVTRKKNVMNVNLLPDLYPNVYVKLDNSIPMSDMTLKELNVYLVMNLVPLVMDTMTTTVSLVLKDLL